MLLTHTGSMEQALFKMIIDPNQFHSSKTIAWLLIPLRYKNLDSYFQGWYSEVFLMYFLVSVTVSVALILLNRRWESWILVISIWAQISIYQKTPVAHAAIFIFYLIMFWTFSFWHSIIGYLFFKSKKRGVGAYQRTVN